MTFDTLMFEFKMMFGQRQNRIMIRRKFEACTWKRSETFREYVHEKVIMGNRIPIAMDEMIEHVIDGIPDNVLQNQAHIQRFTQMESLLEAFEAITLPDGHTTSSNRSARNGKPAGSKRDGTTNRSKGDSNGERKKITPGVKRCFNCGARDHIGVDCPSKDLGVKCFGCGKFGHVASKCPEKGGAIKNSCMVEHSSRKKYMKSFNRRRERRGAYRYGQRNFTFR